MKALLLDNVYQEMMIHSILKYVNTTSLNRNEKNKIIKKFLRTRVDPLLIKDVLNGYTVSMRKFADFPTNVDCLSKIIGNSNNIKSKKENFKYNK